MTTIAQGDKQVRVETNTDVSNDSSSELVVGVGSTRKTGKLSVLAEIGVNEIWQFDGAQLRILILDGNQWVEKDASEVFPDTSAGEISQILSRNGNARRASWLKRFREWARANFITCQVWLLSCLASPITSSLTETAA